MTNIVMLLGRIGSELELRETESGVPVCNFVVRQTKQIKDKRITHSYPWSAFGTLAEALVRKMRKGDVGLFFGELNMEEWYKNETNDCPHCGEMIAENKRRTKTAVGLGKFVSMMNRDDDEDFENR